MTKGKQIYKRGEDKRRKKERNKGIKKGSGGRRRNYSNKGQKTLSIKHSILFKTLY